MRPTRLAAEIVLVTTLVTALAACATPAAPTPASPAATDRPAVAQSEDDDFGTASVYRVVDGALEPEPADPRVASVWDMFVRVATPAFARAGMSEYRTGDAPDSDTLAYVHRDESDPRHWTLAANLAFAGDEVLLRSTLIHEYGHILSLGVDDVDPEATTCDTWEVSEGCVRAGSSIDAFRTSFWLTYGDAAPEPDSDDADTADAFYEQHEADFVSGYAATNVVEDFAESFMTYVLEPETAADSPVARKLAFFGTLPEYAAERQRLRAEFGLD